MNVPQAHVGSRLELSGARDILQHTSHTTSHFSSRLVHLPALFHCIPPQYRCLHAYTTTFRSKQHKYIFRILAVLSHDTATSDIAHCVLLMMSPEDLRFLPSHSEAPATDACMLTAPSYQSLFVPAVVPAAGIATIPFT